MSQYRIDDNRIYEGEWFFGCVESECNGFCVEYSLNEYENHAETFLANTGGHAYERCRKCGSELSWGGYSGNSPVSTKLIELLKNGHFMASTIMLSAIIENSLQDLLWAVLVDNRVRPDRSNSIADGRLFRRDCIAMIKSLSDLDIVDISFPTRNLVAHGKGFAFKEDHYQQELDTQIQKIGRWIDRICDGQTPSRYSPNETERWLLFMSHWKQWLCNYVQNEYVTPAPAANAT